MRKDRLAASIGIIGAVGVTLCFHQPALAADPVTVKIVRNAANRFIFEPPGDNISVEKNQEIKWAATSPDEKVDHELGPDPGEAAFEGTGVFQGSLTHSFATPGVIKYNCKKHPGTMKGTITVKEAAATPEPKADYKPEAK